jgi:L-lactate dehydrogenase complex protein LldG
MTSNASAKDEILARIRNANRGESTAQMAASDWESIPRTYVSAPKMAPKDVVELLIDRLRDYDAAVETVSLRDVPAAIVRVLASRGNPSVLVPPGFPADLLADGDFTTDKTFSSTELDHFEGIITMATLAIAETGTIVLQNVPGQGRRAATLVPDFHLCVLKASDTVGSVPEAVRRLVSTAHLPTTFISGPSATADIEMTRIKGVHGPRFLHVLLVNA